MRCDVMGVLTGRPLTQELLLLGARLRLPVTDSGVAGGHLGLQVRTPTDTPSVTSA